MDIRVTPTDLAGALIIENESFQDERGFFMESYHKRVFAEHGLDYDFVQDNHSRSARGVLRGFHYQDAIAPQTRMIRCTLGKVLDVVVDIRASSPTFGRWLGVELEASVKRQLLIAQEFAHGFVVLSDYAEVQYKCTNYHNPAAERTLAWDDPDVAVVWPVDDPMVSDRDRTRGQSLQDYLKDPAFR